MDGGIVLVVCGCVSVWVCKSAVNIHSYSLATLVRASPVKSYGVNAGVVFCRGVCAPYWFIERSSRRWGAVPPYRT